MTLTDLAAPLLAQLQAQGFTVLLDCETRVCGGFDFRFAIDVMPEPDMHVNLGEFRFISAETADEAVSLLISRSAGSAFVQVTRVGTEALPAPDLAAVGVPQEGALPDAPEPAQPPEEPVPEAEAPTETPQGIVETLEARGSVALDDLVFASGAAVLEEGDYPSLAALAAWLKANGARSIALVGHTDGSGALASNVALSKRRAEGVRQVLLARYDVTPAQVTAEGVGPLAPRASNETEAGRQKNRRVEAVKTSTQ
jgi:OOP family OmpA-OmpF porin